MNDRQRTVFWGRFHPDRKQRLTLEQLATNLGITRERVRQIESTAWKQAHKILDSCSVLLECVQLFRDACKHAVEISYLEELLGCSLVSEAELMNLFIGLAGSYNESSQYEAKDNYLFFVTKNRFDSDLSTWLRANIPSEGAMTEDLICDAAYAGFPPPLVRKFLSLNHSFKQFGEKVVFLRGALPDRVYAALKQINKAETVEHIAAIANGAASSVRNTLIGDRRFQRVDVRLYGLREWGHEEYSTLADLVKETILADGGNAFADKIVERITAKFAVSESSVRQALAHRTLRWDQTSGIVSLATNVKNTVSFPKPAMTARLHLFEGVWYYRFVIDEALLRGLGKSLRTAAAGLLGLGPGARRVRRFRGIPITFSWNVQARVGAITQLISLLKLKKGDVLYLEIGRRVEAHAFFVSREHYADSKAIVRAAKILNFRSKASDHLLRKRALAWIAASIEIDVNSADLRHSVRLRLSQRNDKELLELVGVV